MEYKRGIDVSFWQGELDWAKLKADGVEFAMLRAGYGQSNVDKQFHRNAQECTRLGIPFGVYWFSYAGTVERARKEAASCIEAIRPYRLAYPVAWDFEYDSVDYLKKQGITATKTLVSDMGRAFLGAVEDAGEDVPAVVVGAEPVLGAGGQLGHGHHLLRVVGGGQGGDDGQQDQQQDADDADAPHGVLPEVPNGLK